MKDLETTWSHIIGRKLSKIRENNGMSLSELGSRSGLSTAYVGAILWRTKKWNESNFSSIGIALGLSEQAIRIMLHESLLEAIEQEYGVDIAFALKSHFKLTDRWVRDAMKFLNDLSKNDKE